mmetsp:Transcript_24690/g.78042  ORF Transcript_24690/g.78042 Transcript_24690/m.78042 type:complete len:218 (+) Transcript_24690:318-971(+)
MRLPDLLHQRYWLLLLRRVPARVPRRRPGELRGRVCMRGQQRRLPPPRRVRVRRGRDVVLRGVPSRLPRDGGYALYGDQSLHGALPCPLLRRGQVHQPPTSLGRGRVYLRLVPPRDARGRGGVRGNRRVCERALLLGWRRERRDVYGRALPGDWLQVWAVPSRLYRGRANVSAGVVVRRLSVLRGGVVHGPRRASHWVRVRPLPRLLPGRCDGGGRL